MSDNRRIMGLEDFAVDTAALVVAGGMTPIITAELIKALEPMLIAKQLCAEDNKLVGNAGTTRRFRRKGAYVDSSSMDFGENADIPLIATPTFDYVDVVPTKFGARELITEDAIEAADIPLIASTLEDLLLAMARRSDTRGWNRLLDVKNTAVAPLLPVSLTGGVATKYHLRTAVGTANPLPANARILRVNRVEDITTPFVYTPGTDCWIDCYDCAIEFAIAPGAGPTIEVDCEYTQRPNAIDATTKGSLTAKKDISKAKTLITASNGSPDTVIVHTDEISDIEQDDNFTTASEYGNNSILLNSEIGKILNCQVMPSQRMYPGVALVAMRGGRLAQYVYKSKPKSMTQEIQARIGDIYAMMREKSDVGVLNESLLTVITNAQIYAKDVTP